jgi:hypothetical protein
MKLFPVALKQRRSWPSLTKKTKKTPPMRQKYKLRDKIAMLNNMIEVSYGAKMLRLFGKTTQNIFL